MRSMLISIALFALATTASASDGSLEINQACAAGPGCFSGDAVGFPVTITTAATSYRLTSSLTVPNENTDAIVVVAADVAIDLNGFSISGPNSCFAPPGGCRFTGTGIGIRVQDVMDRLSVSNGSIVGMGGVGIYSGFGDGYVIRDVRFSNNRFEGVRLDGGAAIVEGITSVRNGGDGIRLGDVASVSGSTAYQNGLIGIETGSGATISGNTAYQNGSLGISAGGGTTISNNSAYKNLASGLVCNGGCTITGNSAFQNEGLFGIAAGGGATISDNASSENLGGGIFSQDGSTVQRNAVSSNHQYGLHLIGATYRENTITGNLVGPIEAISNIPAVNKGDNYCSGPGTVSAACP